MNEIDEIDLDPVREICTEDGPRQRKRAPLKALARHHIIEGVTEGLAVLNARGELIDLNPAAQEIFGCSPQAVGQTIAQVFSAWPELADLSREPVETRTESVIVGGHDRRYYEVHRSPLRDRRGRLIGQVIALHDITERQRVEDALRESERRYRELADSLPETVFEMDLTGRLTFANRAGLEGFGYTQEDLEKGINVFAVIVPEDRDRAAKRMVDLLAGGPAEPREYSATKKDGSRFPVVIVANCVMRGGKPVGLRGLLVDITERRRAEARLLQQEREVAVLEERERLAREMHDGLGQVLSYVNTQAQAVRELLAKGQTITADAHLARLISVAQDAHADVREYILDLKAAVSPERGFFATLGQYLQRFGQNYELQTELIVPDGPVEVAIEPAVEVQLLRIIQEALTNVRKHARARCARVVFALEGHQATVTIEDDGCGFEPERFLANGGRTFGLRIMRERAQGADGSLNVHSTPHEGTRVIVQVPLRRETKGEIDESTASR